MNYAKLFQKNQRPGKNVKNVEVNRSTIIRKMGDSVNYKKISIWALTIIAIGLIFFWMRKKVIHSRLSKMYGPGNEKKGLSQEALRKRNARIESKFSKKERKIAERQERKELKKFLKDPLRFDENGRERTRAKRKELKEYYRLNGSYPAEIQQLIDAANSPMS